MLHFLWMASLFAAAISVGFLIGYHNAKNEDKIK